MATKLIVREYMTHNPIGVRPEDPIRLVFEIMDSKKFRHIPVIDQARAVVGVITERDLRDITAGMDLLRETIEGEAGRVFVKDVMSSSVISLDPDSSLARAATIMNEKKIGGLPIIESGVLVGIITYTDILRAMIDVCEGRAAIS